MLDKGKQNAWHDSPVDLGAMIACSIFSIPSRLLSARSVPRTSLQAVRINCSS